MNNKFGDCCNCPAMVDGRFFTRYDDRIELDIEIMKKNNISDSLALRKYLIDNGSKVIDSNIKNLESSHKCKYDKPLNQPAVPINSGYYISGPLSDPTLTLAPFDSLNDNNSPSAGVVPMRLPMTSVDKTTTK